MNLNIKIFINYNANTLLIFLIIKLEILRINMISKSYIKVLITNRTIIVKWDYKFYEEKIVIKSKFTIFIKEKKL